MAAEIAALLTERGLGGDAVDLGERLAAFRRDRSRRAEDARRLARRLARRARARRRRRRGARGERRPAVCSPAPSPSASPWRAASAASS